MKMKKTLLTLLLVLFLMLIPVTSVQAAQEVPGGSADSGTQITNTAPVIEKSSLLVQIIDEAGVAWQWLGGSKSGGRAAPYIFEKEKIRVQLDVSDNNSITDFQGMSVKVALGPSIEIVCSLESTTIDTVKKISKGHYSGNLTIDSSLEQGKYDIIVTAADPQSAADSYDPQMYQDTSDILMKPTVSLQITKPSVTFGVADPGGQMAATEMPMGLRPEAVIGSDHIPVVFSLLHVGTDMKNSTSNDTIPASKIIWSLSNQPGGAKPLVAGSNQTIATLVKEGQLIEVYYWLNVPFSQGWGTYNGKIDYKMIAD
jgi:hypothetical protein